MEMETVRDTVTRSVNEAKNTSTKTVGLVENQKDIPFQCGTCEYYSDNTCHNEHPKLRDRPVEPEWCCNLYDHEGMRTIV